MTDSRTLSARLRAKKQDWYRIMANHPAYQDTDLLNLMEAAAGELDHPLLDAAKRARWALEAMVTLHGPDPAGMSLAALNELDRVIRATEGASASNKTEG